jgi:hypothetical protein
LICRSDGTFLAGILERRLFARLLVPSGAPSNQSGRIRLELPLRRFMLAFVQYASGRCRRGDRRISSEATSQLAPPSDGKQTITRNFGLHREIICPCLRVRANLTETRTVPGRRNGNSASGRYTTRSTTLHDGVLIISPRHPVPEESIMRIRRSGCREAAFFWRCNRAEVNHRPKVHCHPISPNLFL